jgi:Domain of unknown function (DUF4265)
MAGTVKIHFQLTQDEDGYPPVTVESAWAQSTDREDAYTIDNVPFFTRDATLGDTVAVRREGENLWFREMVQSSENSLIRVVFFDKNSVEDVHAALVALGCDVEHMKELNLLAVSVPPSTKIEDVQSYLQSQTDSGRIDYEEAILRH